MASRRPPANPLSANLRRFGLDGRGFTGAEKALLITVGLALVLLVGGLLRAGSLRAGADAQRVLATQEGGGRVSGTVGPIRSGGGIAAAGDQAGGPSDPALLAFSGDYGAPAPGGNQGSAAGGQGQPAPAPAVQSGLGAGVDKLVNQSPTLSANVRALQAAGWTIEYGTGSYTDRAAKKVIIDRGLAQSPMTATQIVAHESGHARYTPEPRIPRGTMTQDQYVDANVKRDLRDEGEATIVNLQVRRELLAAGAGDIGIAGTQGAEYQRLFNAWDGKDRVALRNQIGAIYGTGERPNIDATKNYYEYYARQYR